MSTPQEPQPPQEPQQPQDLNQPPQAPAYSQPTYQQPYAPPPASASKPKTWMNIVSLVTSLLGMGLIGVIFGHLGVSAANKGEADLKGLGIAGLVLGYLGILVTIILAIFFFAAFAGCAGDPECVAVFE